MKTKSLQRCLGGLFVATALAGFSANIIGAEVLVGSAAGGKLVLFPSNDPEDVSVVKLKGLQDGEEILGVDARPSTGQLYALGSSSRLYTINLATHRATQVGSGTLSTPLQGSKFGFDFNPTVDRIRVVSDSGQNMRLNPTNGAVVAVDGSLAYATNDTGFGTSPVVGGAAYINNDNDPATGTTLFDIDSARDVLVTQIPPNSGVLNTVGSLGVNTTSVVGFDVAASDGTAYASLLLDGDKRAGLYTINLSTGAATFLGTIGGPKPLSALATLGTIE